MNILIIIITSSSSSSSTMVDILVTMISIVKTIHPFMPCPALCRPPWPFGVKFTQNHYGKTVPFRSLRLKDRSLCLQVRRVRFWSF